MDILMEGTQINGTNYCDECRVGIYRKSSATFYQWVMDHVVMVPNFPCVVCDVCGRRLWDDKALRRLEFVLAPDVERMMAKAREEKHGGKAEARSAANRKRVRRVARS